MNSILPNMRLLCLPSESLGQDWVEKSDHLDSLLLDLGMDLAEEVTYFLFSLTPKEALEGEGVALIARSVIGPKKNVDAPLRLIDWVAAPVWRETVQGESLAEILSEAEKLRLKAEKGPRPLGKSFFLSIRRRLKPKLEIQMEVLFYE